MCMHACLWACVFTCGWRTQNCYWVSSFLRQSLSVNLTHIDSTGLAGQRVPGILLSQPSQLWDYRPTLMVFLRGFLGIQHVSLCLYGKSFPNGAICLSIPDCNIFSSREILD